MDTALEPVTQRACRRSMVWSILLIVFGFAALALPAAASVGVVWAIGWLLLFDGVVQVIHAVQSQGIGHILWKLLVAVAYLAVGVYLFMRPGLGVAGLTLALGIFFVIEGVVDVIAYFSTRRRGASGWMLADGIVTLLLGFLIWRQWPYSSLWVIGTLLGISMLLTGITRLMMTLGVRRLLRAHVEPSMPERGAA